MSTSKSKPRGVHGYTGGHGRRCYRIEYVGTDGVRRFKRLGPVNLKEAVEARENLNVSIRRREVVVDGRVPTFREVREEWVATRTIRRRTAESLDAQLRHHGQTLEHRRIGDIGKADLLGLLAQVRRIRGTGPLSEGTKAQVLAAISSVFAFGVDMGYVARNPCRDLSKNQRPHQGEGRRRILTEDEVTRLLAYCASKPWLRPIIVTSLAQALRISEAAGLQRVDVDFARSKLRVHQQLTREGELAPTKGATRNRRDRRDTHPIDLMPATRQALLELFTDDLANSGFVFRNGRGGPRLARDIARAFQTVVGKAGLPETEDGRVTFHSLRHTALSRLANHPSIPLVYVRDFAGHATLTTTETYVHKLESAETTAAAVLAMAGTSGTFAARKAGNGED